MPDSGAHVDLSYKIIPPSSAHVKKYRYSYEAKIINPDLTFILVGLGIFGKNAFVISSVNGIAQADQWMNVTDVSDTTSIKIDSIIVKITAYSKSSQKKTYLDNIRVVEEDYN